MNVFKRSLQTFQLPPLMHLKPERNPLVSAEWLSKNLEKVVPVDATYYNVYQRSMIKGPEHTPLQDMENILNWILKKEKKKLPRDISTDASAQFEMGHIPNSRLFEPDTVSSFKAKYVPGFPCASDFADYCGSLGIQTDDHVVLYDSKRLGTASGIYWLFRAMGHQNVSLLNGGLEQWIRSDLPLEKGPSRYYEKKKYLAMLNENMTIGLDSLSNCVADFTYPKRENILDNRPYRLYMGQETPEFQHRLFGHIPGSFNIPTNELLTEFGTFKSREDIFALFAKKKVDIRHGFILVGNTWVETGVLQVALEIIGCKNVQLYTGGMMEWLSNRDTFKRTFVVHEVYTY